MTVALLVGLMAFSGRAQVTRFDRALWLQDYATLKQALEKSYSNLAWFASPEGGVDLPALDRRTLTALQSAQSDDEARSVLLSFVTSFHDGHFSPLPSVAPVAAAHARPDTPAYSRQDAAGGCAALGFSFEGTAAFSTPFESQRGFHLLADGLTQPFRAGELTAGDTPVKIGIVRIHDFESTQPSLCLEVWPQDNVWDAQGNLRRGVLQDEVEARWYQALATLLRTFRTDGVAAVLVDVGNNPGGDDSGDIAARLFTARPLRSSPLWMSQDQTASTPYFDEQLTDLHDALGRDPASQNLVNQSFTVFTAQKDALTKNVCPMDWVWRERRAWAQQPCRRLTEAGSAGGPLAYLAPGTVANPDVAQALHWPALIQPLWGTWTGSLYVLTNSHTYSAAEMFAAVLQNNQAAKIIGERTGGDGCGFMNTPDPVVLPNSHLRFRVPNCVRIRADSTDEVAGVTPDIPILPTQGENPRWRAIRLLGALSADLERRGPPSSQDR